VRGEYLLRKVVYVQGCVFSQGHAAIYDEAHQMIGAVQHDENGRVQVMNGEGRGVAFGKFIPTCKKWVVMNHDGQEVGQMREKFSLFSKKCEYNVYERGTFTISFDLTKGKFSVRSAAGEVVAELLQDGDEYRLVKDADKLSMYELLSVLKSLTNNVHYKSLTAV